MASRNTALAIKIDNFNGNIPSLSFNIFENKVSSLLISFHQHKGNILVQSYSKLKKNSTVIYFSVFDKPNICTVSKLGKFAFVYGKIVNINQIVKTNSETSLYMCRLVNKAYIKSWGIWLILYWHKKYKVKNIKTAVRK